MSLQYPIYNFHVGALTGLLIERLGLALGFLIMERINGARYDLSFSLMVLVLDFAWLGFLIFYLDEIAIMYSKRKQVT